jgi:hypothetical protein
MPSEDSWYTFSGQFTVTSNTPTALTFIAADSSGLTTGDVFAIANGSYGKQQDAGDTTATTLGEFLTEDVTALYDAEDGTTSGWVKSDFGGSSTTISNVTSGAISGTRSIQIDITSGSTSTGYPRVRRSTSNELSLSAGLQYRIKCKLKLTSGAAKVFARLGSASGNTAFGSQTLVVGEVIEVDNTFTPSSIGGSANNIEFVFDGTLGTGTILVDDLELTALNHDATVVTWYDQSVNGYDATQDTAVEQPKIAEAGSLLSEGLLIESGQHFSRTLSGVTFALNDASSFVLGRANGGQGVGALVAVKDLSRFSSPYRYSSTQGFRYGGESASLQPRNQSLQIFTLIGGSTTADGYANGTLYRSVASSSASYTNPALKIGSYSGNLITGEVKEIIIYTSDQSDNRFKIESNINNHYGIYTPAHNGFVETWYDQSGNGRHAVQSAVEGYQPKIVSNGAITTNANGNPAIDFDGVDDFLEMDESTNPFDSNGDMSSFVYCDYSTTTKGGQAYAYKFGPSTAGTRFGRAYSTQMRIFHHDGSNEAFVQTTSVPSGDNLFSSVLDRSANVSFYQNGSLIGTADATVLTGDIDASPKIIGAGSTTAVAAFGAPITEMVIYPSDQSANRSTIEDNINSHYSIYP